MKQKKLNTWTIKRHNYVLASQSYDSTKSESELRSLAAKFIVDHNIYDYKLRIELSYNEEGLK